MKSLFNRDFNKFILVFLVGTLFFLVDYLGTVESI
jgi:hypothetical protein